MSESALALPSYDRIIKLIQRQMKDKISTPFELRLGDYTYRFGQGSPALAFTVNDRNGLAALCSFDELKFCDAYISGSLDVAGDISQLAVFRKVLTDRHPLHYLLSRLLPFFIGQIKTNHKAISSHYEHDKDFFLLFMDETRCYSQAVFERDDEELARAQRRKLDYALQACQLRPGDRLLDVGGGWGERLYRTFRLYLWGSAHTFANHGLEAFRVVLERPPSLAR